MFRWPLITENKHLSRGLQLASCDPQLSNFRHNVGCSKDCVFQILIISEFYQCKWGLFVEQIMQFKCVSLKFCFKETRFVYFFTDPELHVEFTVHLEKVAITVSSCITDYQKCYDEAKYKIWNNFNETMFMQAEMIYTAIQSWYISFRLT